MERILPALVLLLVACGEPPAPSEESSGDASPDSWPEVAGVPVAPEPVLDELLAQYAPYEMFFDASGLPDGEKALLKKLVEASEAVDELYLLQTSKAGIAYREALEGSDDPRAEKALTLLERNAMPYDQLEDHRRFLGDVEFYAGHELYPRGMSAAEFDAWHATLDAEERERAMSPYTVIREDGEGGYRAVPYHEEYADDVARIAVLLREAADLAENDSFRRYLRLKAEALETDDYFEADVAWIDLQGNRYELVIGPFETYADGIKGVKAKYESFVEIVDRAESANLERYKAHLAAMEADLPIPDEYKSNVEGLTAKFVIVRDVHRGGEAGAGYQAVAANLPNDPRVHAEKGTVKTFWKNMFTARFDEIIEPLARRLIAEDQQRYLSADGFFQFVLQHEISHALGPRVVKVGPEKGTAANAAIGPAYNKLEEAKADIAGLVSLAYLMDNGVVDPAREREFYVSYLGSLFRSVRFGTRQAHGAAAALSLRYLTEQGAIAHDPATGRWRIVFDRFREGVRALARELLLLLGDGDGEAVERFFEEWGGVTPELDAGLASVEDLPVDVMPSYHVKWE